MEEKKRKREEQKKLELAKKGPNAAAKVAPPPPDDGCIIDRLLQEIRDGTSLRPMKGGSIKRGSIRGSIRKGGPIKEEELKKLKDMAEKSEKVEAKKTSLANLKAALDSVKEEGEGLEGEGPVKLKADANSSPSKEMSIDTPTKETAAVVDTPTAEAITIRIESPKSPTTNTPKESDTNDEISHERRVLSSSSSTVSVPDPVANLPKSSSSSSFMKDSSPATPPVVSPTTSVSELPMMTISAQIENEKGNVPPPPTADQNHTPSVTHVQQGGMSDSVPSNGGVSNIVQIHIPASPEKTTLPQQPQPPVTNGTITITPPPSHAPDPSPTQEPRPPSNDALSEEDIPIVEEKRGSLRPPPGMQGNMRSVSASPSFGKTKKKNKKKNSSTLAAAGACTGGAGYSSDSEVHSSETVDHIIKLLNQHRPASGLKLVSSVALVATPTVAEDLKESKIAKKKRSRDKSVKKKKRAQTPDIELISVKSKSSTLHN